MVSSRNLSQYSKLRSDGWAGRGRSISVAMDAHTLAADASALDADDSDLGVPMAVPVMTVPPACVASCSAATASAYRGRVIMLCTSGAVAEALRPRGITAATGARNVVGAVGDVIAYAV